MLEQAVVHGVNVMEGVAVYDEWCLMCALINAVTLFLTHIVLHLLSSFGRNKGGCNSMRVRSVICDLICGVA